MLDFDFVPRPTPLRSGAALVAFGSAVTGAAALGAQASARPKLWYRLLRKSRLNPPSWVFGPVWTALYALIATSGWKVWKSARSPARTQSLILWATQLGLNAAWSPLFFGRRRARTALVDLAAMAAVSTVYVQRASKVDSGAAWVFAPALAWVTFAGFLNTQIVRRNPLLGRG